MAILFKEDARGDAAERPDEARRRRRDGPDRRVRRRRPRPGGRGDRRAAASPRPAAPVLAEAERLVAEVALAPARASRPGLDGILVVAKPAGPDLARRRRPRPPPRGDAARRARRHARPVRDRACCRVFLGRATRVVEYHLGDAKGYRATVCFGASSTTDDLEGELTPADGPAPDAGRPSRRRWPRFLGDDRAAAARLQRDQGRRPPGLRDGPRRRDGRAGRAAR